MSIDTAGLQGAVRRCLLTLAAIEALVLLLAGGARADYHVEVCSDLTTGAPSNASGWTASSSGSYVGASPCNGGGYMWAALFSGVSHNYTDSGSLTFTAPAHTTISSFYLWRWDQAGPEQPYGAPVNTISYDGQAIDACSQAFGCGQEGSTTSPTGSVVGASGLAAHGIEVAAACGGGSGGVCPASSEQTAIHILGGDIDLNQSTSPVAGPASGSLLAGGIHSGVQSASFSASDDGSGVYSATLLIDGKETASEILDTNGGRCQPTRQNSDGSLVFNYIQPCPANASGAFTYNTAQLDNGNHDLQIRIADAAGNAAYAYAGTITTYNSAGSAAPGAGPVTFGAGSPWNVTLHVGPLEVHRHTQITLSGTVITSPRPPQGKLIYLQARAVSYIWRRHGGWRHRVIVGGPWITFRVLLTEPSGLFAAHYRFRLGGDHTYQFRAVAPKEGGYLNWTGRSPAVLVTEA